MQFPVIENVTFEKIPIEMLLLSIKLADSRNSGFKIWRIVQRNSDGCLGAFSGELFRYWKDLQACESIISLANSLLLLNFHL